ncbi:MAG: lamin tail domain-containing protein [Bacteroidetes bacterium]|nr:lamin tail domain-containing protein [Bacteroidota bacterium]
MKKLLLFGATLFSFAAAQAQCTELFFSEIVEGSGNDKAFEIYNPTANPINLSNYRVVRFSNGSPTPVDSSALVGTVGAYDVFTLVNGQTVAAPNSPACSPALQAMADQLDALYPASTYANGDDAICLVKISPYQIIHIYGRIGEDPGTAWTDEFPFNGGTGTS